MADVGIEQLKEDIQADIKANNNQTITGDLLQERLIDTVDTLKGYTDDHVSVSQITETGKTALFIGNNPELIVDNEVEKNSENLVKSAGVYSFGSQKTAAVYVKSADLRITKFFKELYIVPTFPAQFNISDIKYISIYRAVSAGGANVWIIGFNYNESTTLSFLRTESSPESTDIITVPAASTNSRFTAYIVADWSQIDFGTSVYLATSELVTTATDIKNSPYIYAHNNLENVYNKTTVDEMVNSAIKEEPNTVAKEILFRINSTLNFISLSSGASISNSTLELQTSSTRVSYVGTLSKDIFPQLCDFYGKWIAVHIKAKIESGSIDDVNLYNCGIYPATIQRRNNAIISDGDYLDFYVEVLINSDSDQTGQLYVPFSMKQTATNAVSIKFLDYYYSLIEDTDESITKQNRLLTEVIEKKRDIKVTHLYCNVKSGTNDMTHFYGLSSITDAINSITDNDYFNRYLIHISGQYHFNNISYLTMPGVGNEYSVIEAKPYVSFEGEGIDKTVLFVDLPANGFEDLDYSHYQPIYVECDGEVNFSNMTVIGKNCRYTIHLEIERSGSGFAIRNFKNMRVIHLGLEGVSTLGFDHAFGCGMGSGHIWNLEDCYMESATGDFRVHNNLHDSINQGTINFTNCTFGKTGFGVDTYSGLSDMNVNMVGCSFSPSAVIANTTNQYGNHKLANSSKTIIKASTPAVIYDDHMGQGKVIRINAADTSKVVSFDISASAFNVIIGDSTLTGKFFTDEAVWTQYGYYYRKGFAYGSIDVDVTNGNRSIGKLLGDCTSINKVLRIVIDGTSYSVTFNENYTNATNDYILGEINTVLDGVGTAELFSINKEYYPQFDGLIYRTNDDSGMLAGMGIVFTEGGIKKAKSTDGYIDGICLDTVQQGEVARVLTKGLLWTRSYASGTKRFKILETENSGSTIRGASLGISSTQDGYFDTNAETKLIRCVLNSKVNIKP